MTDLSQSNYSYDEIRRLAKKSRQDGGWLTRYASEGTSIELAGGERLAGNDAIAFLLAVKDDHVAEIREFQEALRAHGVDPHSGIGAADCIHLLVGRLRK